MTEREKFLFDLQGFLKIPNFLTPQEVKALNDSIDANPDRYSDSGGTLINEPAPQLEGEFRRGSYPEVLTWPKPWCDPFRDLLAHPKAIPYLNEMHGRGWRMDHTPFVLTSKIGTEGLQLHGSTARKFDGPQYYTYANDTMRCGMVVFEYKLAHVNEGDGGLCVIPGSHKANYRVPDEIRLWEVDQHIVYNIPCNAGDLVIFNEATIHGTLPWKADHERRSLLYRYSPRHIHFAAGYHETSFPEWVNEMTEAQRAVVEPPYIYNRPLIEDDGVTVVRPHRE